MNTLYNSQATAIYQAKQKLQSIARANKRPVGSEDLIKFAHRISASNAVCAPLTWQQGDPRRPYPTGIISFNLFAIPSHFGVGLEV